MRRKKEIDEWAFDYWLLQQYATLCFRLYYRKIEILGKHRITAKMPVIIAPNHQNALMDAMIFVSVTNFQNVFLARADIFKGKRLTKFLTYLNIMPIFRIRDGIENVKRNDEVFEKTTRVLHNNHNPLILFPEGSHGDRRRLRPLVKGLFRIAFQAQEKFRNKPGVKIVPVGIEYGHYQHFRTTLLIIVGEPIEVSGLYNSYAENPVAAINELKEIYAEKLSQLMIDIQTEEFYPLFMNLREIFNDDMRRILGTGEKTLFSRFKADKVLIGTLNKELECNPAKIQTLDNLVNGYQNQVRKAGIRDWILKDQPFGFMNLAYAVIEHIVLLPVFLFGLINNIIPYWFTASRVTKIKDLQFHSSFKYVMGMIVFPVWYLLIAGILALLSLPFWVILLYLVLLPLAGLTAFSYYIHLKKLIGKIKFSLRKNSDEMVLLIEKRKQIIDLVTDIVNRNLSSHENPR